MFDYQDKIVNLAQAIVDSSDKIDANTYKDVTVWATKRYQEMETEMVAVLAETVQQSMIDRNKGMSDYKHFIQDLWNSGYGPCDDYVMAWEFETHYIVVFSGDEDCLIQRFNKPTATKNGYWVEQGAITGIATPFEAMILTMQICKLMEAGA